MNLQSLTPQLKVENCLFFKLMALLALFSAVIILITGLLSTDKNKNWYMVAVAVLSPLVNYYIFLLFNSMCEASLH